MCLKWNDPAIVYWKQPLISALLHTAKTPLSEMYTPDAYEIVAEVISVICVTIVSLLFGRKIASIERPLYYIRGLLLTLYSTMWTFDIITCMANSTNNGNYISCGVSIFNCIIVYTIVKIVLYLYFIEKVKSDRMHKRRRKRILIYDADLYHLSTKSQSSKNTHLFDSFGSLGAIPCLVCVANHVSHSIGSQWISISLHNRLSTTSFSHHVGLRHFAFTLIHWILCQICLLPKCCSTNCSSGCLASHYCPT